MIPSKLTGLIAAPHTPFNRKGALNLEIIPKQAHWLGDNEVSGAFICGTTGEWSSLTIAERIAVAEKWMASVTGPLKVIVHTGHNCLADAQTLAAHAEKVGAFAIAAMAPDYFRPSTVAALVEFCSEIAAAAPKLPFFYYHMPGMNGVNFPVIDFLRLGVNRIPTLAGVKYTHENLMDYRQCVAFDQERLSILFGRDEIMLAALAMGAEGFVGSTYNFAAPIYRRLISAFRAGDLSEARQKQSQAIEVIAALSRYGGLNAGKAVMAMLGIDCGPMRAPLQSVPEEAVEALRNELEGLQFFALPNES